MLNGAPAAIAITTLLAGFDGRQPARPASDRGKWRERQPAENRRQAMAAAEAKRARKARKAANHRGGSGDA